MGPPIALDLVKAAQGALLPVQAAIVDVLVQIGPAGLPELSRCSVPMFRDEFSECDFAVRAVQRMGDEALTVLEAWAPEPSSARASFALHCLRSFGPKRSLSVLERLTRHPDERVRRDAFGIIASWNDPMIGDVLVKGLEDRDGPIVSKALTGLRKIRDRRLIPVALTLAADDRNGGLQEDAVAGLGVFFGRELLQPILRVARQAPDVGARRTGVSTLVWVKDSIANRLGQRYDVITVDPGAQPGIWMRHMVQLGGTALFVFVCLRLAALIPLGVLVSGCVLTSAGYFWGNVITKINGSVERELLLLMIPCVWLVARILGVKLLGLADLAMPFVLAMGGGLVASICVFALGQFRAINAVLLSQYGWVLVYTGLLFGAAIGFRRFLFRQEAKKVVALEHNVKFTRLATVGCVAFYAGYVFGWWRLWDYSSDAFRCLL
ncbi:MAG: HEAT repeat domain-containing protein [Vicinamibacteria bacterium]